MPGVARPKTQYALSGDVHVAYQLHGSGDVPLIMVSGPASHLDVMWEHPPIAGAFRRLGRFARVARLDRRGTGLSDAATDDLTLEAHADDQLAVMDAVGFERAAVLGFGTEAARASALLAATRPDRVSSLVLVAPSAVSSLTLSPALLEAMETALRTAWQDPTLPSLYAPSSAEDPAFLEFFRRNATSAASPAAWRRLARVGLASDVRDVLPLIRVPTLVLHREGDEVVPSAASREVADLIPGARFVELPGRDNYAWCEPLEPLLDEVEEFLTGVRPAREPQRVLSTVLFTDVVDSTRTAARLGDAAWGRLRHAHDEEVRRAIADFGGREVKTLGDGFLATFDGPARAVRCAQAAVRGARGLGLELRAGVHTGECELEEDDVTGLAVHLAARIVARAEPGETLVSGTVHDLVVGSELAFAERGEHELKGLPGRWRLFRALEPEPARR